MRNTSTWNLKIGRFASWRIQKPKGLESQGGEYLPDMAWRTAGREVALRDGRLQLYLRLAEARRQAQTLAQTLLAQASPLVSNTVAVLQANMSQVVGSRRRCLSFDRPAISMTTPRTTSSPTNDTDQIYTTP